MSQRRSHRVRVPPLREIAQLIADATSWRGAARVARMLGFRAPLPLDRPALTALGIDDVAARAWVADGPGSLRCCIVRPNRSQPVRLLASRCAVRLADRSPHILWVVLVVSPADHLLVVAVPPAPGSSRVVALVADTRRVQQSDAETVAAMAAATAGTSADAAAEPADGDAASTTARGRTAEMRHALRDSTAPSDVLVHHRWRELLGRDALTRRFYRELESAITALATSASGRAPVEARREMALVCTSRLIFLAFLEAKGWLDGDREFLRHRYDAQCTAGGSVHRRLLDPLFFGTLNTPVARRSPAALRFGRVPFLNGGLFSRTPIEQRWTDARFGDDAIGQVICGLLGRYRVTAREESSSWSEAAIDPEMLGRAFESLMAGDDRRSSGAFYTPVQILERVTTAGLEDWLNTQGVPDRVRRAIREGDRIPEADRARVLALISGMRVLDPACGSGAFLVHVMERLADIRGLADDRRPVTMRRRDVLSRSIFGVDVNPMAVWLCELRLWLSVVIDATDRDGMGFAPLPNLDHHVRIGDALAGSAFDDSLWVREAPHLATLRRRYAHASGARKRTLARAVDAGERRIAIAETECELELATERRRDVLAAARSPDLFARRAGTTAAMRADLAEARQAAREARRRLALLRSGGALPFSFRIQFADVGARGGFDLVVGNPPWVRPHRIGPAARADLAARFQSWRDAPWIDGARDAHAGRGFASQVDLAALFVERSVQLARTGATISLLVPAKLWLSLSAGGLRNVLMERCRIVAVEDWSESPAAFDAVVYPSMIVVSPMPVSHTPGGAPGILALPTPAALTKGLPDVRQRVHRGSDALEWDTPAAAVPLDVSPGAPWVLIPPGARDAFTLLTERGVPFAHTRFGRPVLGVKTGCNDAFVVTPDAGWARSRASACGVRGGNEHGDVDRALLRPVLRGQSVRAWQATATRDAIVWTHGPTGAPLDTLPSATAAWLSRWRNQLVTRTDATRARRHWELFRTDAADSHRPRVVWSDISRTPRALVLPAGHQAVPLNTCYVAFAPTLDDAHALAALLNSAPIAAWLCALAEPARGGYRRFLGWTIARLPLPADWARAVALLAPLAQAAAAGAPPDPEALGEAVSRAYDVPARTLHPLAAWCLR